MTAKERIEKLAESIANLYYSIYEIDYDGMTHYTKQFESALPTEETDSLHKLEKDCANLSEENKRLKQKIQTLEKQNQCFIDQLTSLKRKYARILESNIKMCEHIKEIHEKDS